MRLLLWLRSRSPDGRRFEKSDEIWADFEHTEAYSMLFIELATDADKASEFINAVFPNDSKTSTVTAPIK